MKGAYMPLDNSIYPQDNLSLACVFLSKIQGEAPRKGVLASVRSTFSFFVGSVTSVISATVTLCLSVAREADVCADKVSVKIIQTKKQDNLNMRKSWEVKRK